MNLENIIMFVLLAILVLSVYIFVKKTMTYISDERGLVILARAAQIVFGFLFLLFSIFMIYIFVIDVFDLPQTKTMFSIKTIRNYVIFVMSSSSLVNVLSIKFLEEKM